MAISVLGLVLIIIICFVFFFLTLFVLCFINDLTAAREVVGLSSAPIRGTAAAIRLEELKRQTLQHMQGNQIRNDSIQSTSTDAND